MFYLAFNLKSQLPLVLLNHFGFVKRKSCYDLRAEYLQGINEEQKRLRLLSHCCSKDDVGDYSWGSLLRKLR